MVISGTVRMSRMPNSPDKHDFDHRSDPEKASPIGHLVAAENFAVLPDLRFAD
jgi:hypothetical protein